MTIPRPVVALCAFAALALLVAFASPRGSDTLCGVHPSQRVSFYASVQMAPNSTQVVNLTPAVAANRGLVITDVYVAHPRVHALTSISREMVEVDIMEGNTVKATVASGGEASASAGFATKFGGGAQTRFESGVQIGTMQPLNIQVTRGTTRAGVEPVKVTVCGYVW